MRLKTKGMERMNASQEKVHDLAELHCYRQYIYQVGKSLWKTIENEWVELLAGTGLCINEHTILTLLNTHGAMAISDLAELGMMHISTAQNFSKKLEKNLYLKSKKSEKDKRVTHLSITTQGKQMLKDIEKSWHSNDSKLVNDALNMEMVLGEKPYFRELLALLKLQYHEDIIEKMLINKPSVTQSARYE